ncbi:MAG TPA: DUF6600 domain-containing protein, partial [Burkholderiaceae bacterium]|nr:DUF6600 domain-containing protein [Burkholderiaceae bacterium]
MNIPLRFLRVFAFLAGVAMLAFSSLASADPPSRVARLAYMSGEVSFSPAGDEDWVRGTLNRPLTIGDRLWVDARSRAEVQIGGAVIRMNAETDVTILNLDDQVTQLRLTQGALSVRVRRLEPDQTFEVDTPNLAFTLRQPGRYRIEVDPDGNATSIYVGEGQGEAYGEGAAYLIDASQPYRFTGTGLREYQYADARQADDFDRWAAERDRSFDNSASVRYVSPDVIGYQDLDTYGSWRADATYGNVWVPSRVSADWAPYHDGHWVWVDPWGWTWVDDAPWGFAVSHYGRWAYVERSWCWVPGPVVPRVYYAPALVAFVGGDNFSLSISSGTVGAVAWFPLGPREVYRPWYPAGRRYFEQVNVTNTVVNTTVINNYYNNTNVTNVVYANRQVPGAVVAVPKTAFALSEPVGKIAVRVPPEKMASAPVAIAPSVTPTERSVRGPTQAGSKPPPKVAERVVVARTPPPEPHPRFEALRQQSAANQGKPPAEDARRDLKAAAPAQRPAVKVIAQRPDVRPERPPPVTPGARPGDGKADEARGKPDERKGAEPPANANAPRAPGQVTPPEQAARPPDRAARPPEQRGRTDQPGRAEQPETGGQRGEPVAPPAARAPQDVPRPPTARPPEQRAKPPEQRERDE